MRHLRLAEYLHQRGITDPSEGVIATVDALRLGCGPRSLEELAGDPGAPIWIEASKLLEHERVTRQALAFNARGVRLEEAMAGAPSEEAAIEEMVRRTDEELAQ